MRRASDPHVKLTIESTGGDPPSVSRLPRSGLKACGGGAWGASVDSGDDGVSVHFHKDEACRETLVFESRKKSWRLTASAQACD